MNSESLYCPIDRREALRTAALLALLLCVAFFNIVFRGESLTPGNNFNPLAASYVPENYGPRTHSALDFERRAVYAYANMHDAGSSWWQGEPADEQLSRALRRGTFPLWDPYIGGGVPAFGNLTPEYLFPPSFLVALLGNEPWLKNLYSLLLFLTAGFFTYVFVRKHRIGVFGSRAAGIAFMFSGAVVQTAPDFFGQSVVGIPVALATTAFLLERPTWKRTSITALAFATISLASFPPVLIFAFSLAVLYAIAVIAFDGQRKPRSLHFGAAAVLALALVAFYYVPAAHVIRGADQVHRFYHEAGMQKFPRRMIFQLLGPAVACGAPVYLMPSVFVPSWNLFYFGVTGLVLAAATFGRIKPRPLLVLFQGMAALLLLKIFGVWPVQLLGKLPVLKSLHIAHYGGILLGFLLAVLTGVAVDLLVQRRMRLPSALVAIAGAGTALAIFWRIAVREGLHTRPQPWRWESDFRLVVLFLLIAAIIMLTARAFEPGTNAMHVAGIAIVGLIAVEGITNAAFLRQPRWNYWDHPPEYLRVLIAKRTFGRVLPFGLMTANTNTPFAIGSVDSLLTFNSDRYALLHHRYFGSPDYILLRECSILPNESVLDAFAVDRILIYSGKSHLIAEAVGRGYQSLHADDSAVLFARNSQPRWFLTRDYAVRSRVDAFLELGQRPSRRLLLDQPASFPSDAAFRGGAVKVERFGFNGYKLRVTSAAPALLYASETDAPGWTATLNGKRVPIRAANFAFRAIEVPAGESVVEFCYWPVGLTTGIIISALALLIVIGIGVRKSA